MSIRSSGGRLVGGLALRPRQTLVVMWSADVGEGTTKKVKSQVCDTM